MSVEDGSIQTEVLSHSAIEQGQPYAVTETIKLFNDGIILCDPSFSHDNGGYPQVDQKKLANYIEERKKKLSVESESEDEFDRNNEYDWKAERPYARKLTREAIKRIYDGKLFDRDIIVKSSHYAGPGNAYFTGEQGSYFNALPLHQYYGENNIEQWGYLPFPATREERNKLVTLEIGDGHYAWNAETIHNIAEQIGVPLDIEAAGDIAGVSIAAHEFTHAIDHALNVCKRNTFINATVLLSDSPLDRLRTQSYRVHIEHFCRAIENQVRDMVMKDTFNMSDKDVERFRQQFDVYYSNTHDNFLDLSTKVDQYGLSFEGLFDLDEYILSEVHGKEKDTYFESLESALAYNLPPYTLDEIRLLSQPNPVNEG